MEEMIDIFKQQPEVGEVVCCEVEMWRHGELHHTEECLAEYIGWNNITKHPMFDIETYDEAYALVVRWRRRKQKMNKSESECWTKEEQEGHPEKLLEKEKEGEKC